MVPKGLPDSVAGLGRESRCDHYPSAGQVDLTDAGLDERQREPGVELEHVVRDARGDLGYPPEGATAFFLDRQADQLEGVVLALRRRRQRLASNRDLGAARHLAIEADHGPTAGTALRRDDLRAVAVDIDHCAEREPLRVVACLVDEEGAVKAVRPSDTADCYKVSRRSRQGCGSSTAPRLRGRSCATPWRSAPGGRSPCRHRPWRRAAGGHARRHARSLRRTPPPDRRRAAAPARPVVQPMSLALSRRLTVSEGCAPFESQSLTFSSSNSIVDGSVCGL